MTRSLATLCVGLALTSSSAWALSCIEPMLVRDLVLTADSPDTVEGEASLRYDGYGIELSIGDDRFYLLPEEEAR